MSICCLAKDARIKELEEKLDANESRITECLNLIDGNRKNAEKWKLQYDHLISSMKTDGGKFKCMSCGGDCVPWSRVEAMNKEIIVERQRHKMAEEVFKAEYKKLDEAYRKERGK